MLKNRSMSQKLLLSINGLVLILIILLSFASLLQTQKQVNSALVTKVNSLKKALAASSVSYIWNFEVEPLNEMTEMILKNDRDISSLEYYSNDGKLLTKKIDIGNTEVFYEATDILKEKEKLGVMRIGYNKIRISEEINSTISSYLLFIIIIMVILAISITLITKSILKPVMGLINELQKSSEVLSNTSNRLNRSGSDLSSQVEDQASALQETSASLEELTGMVTTNLKDSEQSTKVSDEVQAEATEGKKSVSQLIDSMRDVMHSNDEIQELVKVIGAIGEKTQVIDEIVFQTKLLSFNASVEAERAGEHGRGFAVVAQEVGNLAQLSGKAAVEISDIVKSSILSAESITKRNKEKVLVGNKLVEDVASILDRVADKSHISSVSIGQIYSASKEQSLGLQQINTAVTTLDRNMHANTDVAKITAEVSGEVNTQAKNLTRIVNSLLRIFSGGSGENK